MQQVKEDTKKEVRGIIVCKDALPVFSKEFENLQGIQIFHYGWKLEIYPRK